MRKAKNKSVYSRAAIADIIKQGMKIRGAKQVRHIFPRAYCIAKPAPLCAVFVVPWMDAEPQIRMQEYSSSDIVREGVEGVNVGDWRALAYVASDGCSRMVAFPLCGARRPR